VHEAHRRQREGARLWDLRTDAERARGMPSGAEAVAVEAATDDALRRRAGLDDALLLICAAGVRSRRAAERLRAIGYRDVASVEGGVTAWQAAGLPLDVEPLWPGAPVDAAERYDRHLRLEGLGIEGQARLARSRVLLIGAGGLGSPVALYLAAAGIGHLRIADDDLVDRSNLQRQVLHADAAVGRPKADSARERLLALNPGIEVDVRRERLSATNVEALVDGVDVVVDGSDNFPTRYLANAACVRHRLPLVHGAVERFHGQAAVFASAAVAPDAPRAPCYQCLFPEPPGPDEAPDCAEAGVLGVLPGLVGMVQATETLKLLLGLGTPLAGRLLRIDALGMRFRETAFGNDPDCPTCGPSARFTGYADLARWCAAG